MIQVEKIVLNINGEKVKLTLDQARELQQALNDMLGAGSVTYVSPSPIWIMPPSRIYPSWEIVCGDNAVTYSLSEGHNESSFTANS